MLSRMLTSPLSRIRNAGFTRILAAPYASLIRGDFGAEIWRIIRPGAMGNWIAAQVNEKTNEKMVLKNDALRRNMMPLTRNEGLLFCSATDNSPMSANDPNGFARRWRCPHGYDDEPEYPKDDGPGGYCPVRIGDVLHQRYHVIRELGWGSSSITWLCWDEEGKRFVALKIVKSAESYTAAAMKEVKMLRECQEDKDGEHPKLVVQLIDNFTIEGPNGNHVCLVLEAFGGDVMHLTMSNLYGAFCHEDAREIIRQVLEGLRHLHANNIVHTDIKPENLLFTKASNEIRQKAAECADMDMTETLMEWWSNVRTSPLMEFTEEECTEVACPHIAPGGGKLFQLQDLTEAIGAAAEEKNWQSQMNEEEWEIKICDLGSACWTHERHIENVQNRQYCSPELVIGAEFGPPTDIWSTACLAFELTTGEYLFSPDLSYGKMKNESQLARIIQLLGPVPPHILKNGSKWKDVFHESGTLLHSPDLTGTTRNDSPEGPRSLSEYFQWRYVLIDREPEEFADFLISMLKYDPNERATAAQCLKHPWLRSRAARPINVIYHPRNSTASDRLNSLLNSQRSIDIQYRDLQGIDSAAFLKELCASAKFPVSVHLDSVEFDDRTIAECANIVAEGNWEDLKFVHEEDEHEAFYAHLIPSVVALMEKWVNGEAPRFQSVQFGFREDEQWIELFKTLEQLGSLENVPAGTVTIKHGRIEGLVAKVEFDYETCRSELRRVKTGRSHLCIHVCEQED